MTYIVEKRRKRSFLLILMLICIVFTTIFTQFMIILCLRWPSWRHYETLQKASNAVSRCNAHATSRGPGQRVISFGFFGKLDNMERYLHEIEASASLLPMHFPKWTLRVYHYETNSSKFLNILRSLEDEFPFLDLCDIKYLSLSQDFSHEVILKEVWRYLSLDDPLVDVVVTRNALLFPPMHRIAAAVEEWLQSNMSFHVMRDTHIETPAIADGMWGARRDIEPSLAKFIFNNLLTAIEIERENNATVDHELLLKHVMWPSMKGKVVQHDSYFCEQQEYQMHGEVLPWPVKWDDEEQQEFLQYNTKKIFYRRLECPIECRPLGHEDWILC